MYKKEDKELYFAINKKDKTLFNSGGLYKNKISWTKLYHLKGIFKKEEINIKDYDLYKIFIENGVPVLDKVVENDR